MITKKHLQSQLDKFPEEFSIDELVERLVLLEKIEKGNEQSKKGETVTEEDLEKSIREWFE